MTYLEPLESTTTYHPKASAKVLRPDNLELANTEDNSGGGTRPLPPPRKKHYKLKSTVSEVSQKQRDQRLLSVPNIKYSRQDMRDLRQRHTNANDSMNYRGDCGGAPVAGTSGFAGNLMRRFSKSQIYLCVIVGVENHSAHGFFLYFF